MAITTISNVTGTTFSWLISDLGNYFNTTYYIRAGIANNPVVDENTAPIGIIDANSAPSSGTNNSTSGALVSHGKTLGTYSAYGWVQAANGKYYSADSDTYTVPGPTLATPSISSQSVTQTSISITLGSVTGADTYYARINGGSWQSGSGRSFSFTGLTSGTAYTVDYKCTGSGYYDSAVGSSSITTSSNTRPANWSWSASNGSASAAQTQAAYNAVTKVSGYGLSDFSYLVWNDLVDKVDAFAVYKDATLVEAGAKMSSSDKALSADRFNKLLTAVNAMASTGITNRSAGQLVYGSYFTTITNALNNIT